MLHQFLLDKLKREGPITFRAFMEAALYHPVHGYYNQERPVVGGGGDFFTCPAHSPYFGSALAEYVRRVWNELGRPHRFTVVELGGGEGHLAESLLTKIHRGGETGAGRGRGLAAGKGSRPPAGLELEYIIVEKSPARREAQGRRLGKEVQRVGWLDLEDLPSFQGVVIANELFDALPVHQVENTKDGLREVYVAAGPADELVETLGPVSTSDLPALLGGVNLPLGRRTQSAPEGGGILRELARRLTRGRVLIIDYGALSPERHLSNRYGLRTYYRQFRTDNPYARLGRQDMTSDVDFTILGTWAEAAGFRVAGLRDQGEFLLDLGLSAKMAELAEKAGADLAADGELTKVGQLVSPWGLGEMFKVLELSK